MLPNISTHFIDTITPPWQYFLEQISPLPIWQYITFGLESLRHHSIVRHSEPITMGLIMLWYRWPAVVLWQFRQRIVVVMQNYERLVRLSCSRPGYNWPVVWFRLIASHGKGAEGGSVTVWNWPLKPWVDCLPTGHGRKALLFQHRPPLSQGLAINHTSPAKTGNRQIRSAQSSRTKCRHLNSHWVYCNDWILATYAIFTARDDPAKVLHIAF